MVGWSEDCCGHYGAELKKVRPKLLRGLGGTTELGGWRGDRRLIVDFVLFNQYRARRAELHGAAVLQPFRA